MNASQGGTCLYRCLEPDNRSQDREGSSSHSYGIFHFCIISSFTLIVLRGTLKGVATLSLTGVQCQTVVTEYNASCDDRGKLIWKPWSHVQWGALKQPFFKSVISKKPHRIPFQFEKCKSSQQLTGNVRYVPGLSFDGDSCRQRLCHLWLPVFQY